MAEAAGALSCAGPDDEGSAYVEQVIHTATGGLGADHVFLAAGGDSNGPVELAARLARDRARVVDIGKTRLDLPWNAYYEKELDVRFSRSYGPGRYDDRYELDGVDYPAGYVRWTERRNLGCFLDLLASESIEVGSLVSGTRPIDEAADGVRAAARRGPCAGSGSSSSTHGCEAADDRSAPARLGVPKPGTTHRSARPSDAPTVRLGFIGAGSYASSMLLPHLAKNPCGDPRHGRHDPLALRGQRPAQVRLRVGDHRCGRGPRRPLDRRGVRRHPAPLPRGFRLPGPRERQGGLRREAAGADPRRGRRHPRRRRADRQRPDHGRLQPALRAAPRSTCAGGSVPPARR